MTPKEAVVAELVAQGIPFGVKVFTAGASVDEIPPDLLAIFPDELPLYVDPEEFDPSAALENGRLVLTLAFHRLLGINQLRTLRLDLDRCNFIIYAGDGNADGADRSEQRPREKRHLRAVPRDN